MGTKRCVNCMEEITEQVCPHCGYHEEDEQQAIYGLKRNTILHGKYLIGNVLGQGGFGITYIAFDIALEIKVAIKEYFPMGYVSRDCTRSNQLTWNNMQNGQEQLKKGGENFLKEARRMAKIDVLPEIVRVREVFMENQTSYIVMDYVEGETLKAWLLKNGTMGLSECMNMLLPLMNSLSEVHSFGLIHRDISPDNIMVLPNGRIRLLDLGAAKDLGIENNGSSQLVTKKGFSPIEQYMESGKIGTWTDVYALSATIYYCITGKMVPEAVERTITDTLNFDFPMKEKLSETAEETLRRGLAVKPEDRIQTVSEFARLLQGVETDNNVVETDNDVAEIDNNVAETDNNVAEIDNNVAEIDNNVAKIDNNVVETDTAPAEDPLPPVSGTEKEKDAETGHAGDSVKKNKKYKLAIAAVIITAVAAVSVIAIRQKVSDSDVPSAKNADTIENEVEKVKVSDTENALIDNASMAKTDSAASGGKADYHYILSDGLKIVVDGTLTATLDNGQAEFKQQWEDAVGIPLTIDQLEHSSYADAAASILMAGDYPDAMIFSANMLRQYSSTGLLWDMSSAYDNAEFQKRLKLPGINEALKDSEGHLYGFAPCYGNGCVTYVKKAWLDILGMNIDDVKTYDDYYNMLKAFHEGDPDGNGVNGDTYGVMMPGFISTEAPYINYQPEFWQDAYPSLYQKASGEWVDGFQEDATKKALLRLQKAYQDGCIDPETLTASTKAVREKWFANDQTGSSGVFTYWAGSWYQNLTDSLIKNEVDEELVQLEPIQEITDSVGGYINREARIWVIIDDGDGDDTREQAIFDALLETMMDGDTVQMLWTYGAEDVHWSTHAEKFTTNPGTQSEKVYSYEEGEFHLKQSPNDANSVWRKNHLDPALVVCELTNGYTVQTELTAAGNRFFTDHCVNAPLAPISETFMNESYTIMDAKDKVISDVVIDGGDVDAAMDVYVKSVGSIINKCLAELNN